MFFGPCLERRIHLPEAMARVVRHALPHKGHKGAPKILTLDKAHTFVRKGFEPKGMLAVKQSGEQQMPQPAQLPRLNYFDR